MDGQPCFSNWNWCCEVINIATVFYDYCTVHHLDSWMKRDQLDVTCFIISLFNAQHVSDVNTTILRNLRLICWVISWVVLLWFDVCWCYIVVWLGWCGIRTQAEAVLQPVYIVFRSTRRTKILGFKPSPCSERCMLSFWVIPRRLNFICRRFGTLCSIFTGR